MCIAILKTKNGMITDEELKNCFRRNKDGAGIAYTVNNELIVEKGIFDINEFVEKVRAAEKVADNNMLIHCRITTSGNVDELNCHPHVLNENCVMIHNGVLHIDVPKNSKISDTVIYCNKYLKQFRNTDLIHNKALTELIEEHIGSNNKFVIMDNKGDYNIINELAGHWRDGVWFSNTSYEGYKPLYSYDDEDMYYGYYGGYEYTGKYHWEKDDDKTLEPKERAVIYMVNLDGEEFSVDEDVFEDCYDNIATVLDEELTDDDFDILGARPVVDMYDGGTLHASTDTKDNGFIELIDVFPELYDCYADLYEDYVDRMLGIKEGVEA